jgi:hypothetical protein
MGVFLDLVGGRGPLGLPGGQNGPKIGSLWETQGYEISSRRVDMAVVADLGRAANRVMAEGPAKQIGRTPPYIG